MVHNHFYWIADEATLWKLLYCELEPDYKTN